jgi:hypothetical protein
MRDAGAAARVAAVPRELLETRDLTLTLVANRVIVGELLDQLPDPVTHLEREMWCRWTSQRSDVLDRHPAPRDKPIGSFHLAHGDLFDLAGAGSLSGAPKGPNPASPVP